MKLRAARDPSSMKLHSTLWSWLSSATHHPPRASESDEHRRVIAPPSFPKEELETCALASVKSQLERWNSKRPQASESQSGLFTPLPTPATGIQLERKCCHRDISVAPGPG
eukprot:818933-Rhodomonas_salina.1